MKTSLVLALLGACAPSVHAVVHFPFAKHASPPHNVARGGSLPRALNQDFFLGAMTYVVNATVGTPGQPVSLILSPDSSDTWIIDARSEQCTFYSDYYGTYSDLGTDDLDDDYTESLESCIWGSCKSSFVQTADPPDYDFGSVLPLRLRPEHRRSPSHTLREESATVLISRC